MSTRDGWFAVLILGLLTAALSAAEPSPRPFIMDRGISPSRVREKLIKQESNARARQRELQRLAAAGAATNWQEYDVTYYDIAWKCASDFSSLIGAVGVYGRPTVAALDSVVLDFTEKMTVDSVYASSGNLSYTRALDHITIHLDRAYAQGETFGFTVAYHGRPFWDYWGGLFAWNHSNSPTLDNISEPWGSRYWWPCKDIPYDKADSLDVHVTAAIGFTAISNGLLLSDNDNGDGTHTVHWRSRYPIATYLVCLAVAQYTWWRDWYHIGPTDSIPIDNYTYPDDYDSLRASLAVAPEAMGVFTDLFGPYPFQTERYGQTQTEGSYGMEYQTNTFLYYEAALLEEVIIHELAHQWWGDMVTCRNWHHIWLNEGFATYSEALYYEARYGGAAYHEYMADMDYFSEASVYRADTTKFDSIFNSTPYNKGAWVLYMLRHQIGDSAFFATLREYRRIYTYGTATTEDLQAIAEGISGMDLGPFFQQWIYGSGRPRYLYSTVFYQAPGGDGWNTYVHLEQTQTTEPQVFRTPVDMQIWYGAGYQEFAVWNDHRVQDIVLHTTFRPAGVTFDVNGWLLKEQTKVDYTLHIITDSLSPATQGTMYRDTIIAASFYGKIRFTLLSGTLPQGWQFDTVGVLSGLSYDTGSFTFRVRATDRLAPTLADSAEYTVVLTPGAFGFGDANADGAINVGDAVYIVNYIFKGGPPPPLPNLADANGDCAINIGDAVYLINYVFKSGPLPRQGCVAGK